MKYLIILMILVGCSPKPESSSKGKVVSQTIQSSGDGNFGVVPYGEIKIKSFVIANDSLDTLNLTPAIGGNQANDFSLGLTLGCSPLLPGKSCLIKTFFNSNGKISGEYVASLNVGNLSLPLTASIPSVPSVSYEYFLNGQMETSSVDLGSISTDNIKVLSLKIKNNSPMVGETTSLTSSNPFYNILYNGCSNVSLKPNQSCFAKIYLKGDASSENKSGNLSFGNSQLSLISQNISHTYVSNFEAFTPEVELGDFYESGERIIKSIMLVNNGDGIGTLSSIVLPPEYSMASNNCLAVKPGNKCFIRLVYDNPDQTKGQHSDSISLGTSNVDLIVNQVNKPNDLGSINLTVDENILVNECQPILVELKDVENLNYIVSSDTILNSSAQLYSDSTCSTTAVATIPAFEASKSFYIKNTTAGNLSLTVSKELISQVKDIYFYNTFTTNSLSVNIALSENFSIIASGGKPPYVFEKISGVGSISNSGLFNSDFTGSGQLKVSDALGHEVFISTNVVSNISVSAGTCTFANHPEGVSCTVNASGGVGSKTFSTSNGNIDPVSGSFYGICNNNVGSSTVTATDSNGNTGSVVVTYPCVYKSCSELRAKGFGLTSGDYWLDPDGLFRSGTTSPNKIYCDFRADGTYAFMAEKKAADGIYYPPLTSSSGGLLGFYNFGPSANGTFSKDLKIFSPISSGVIMLEDLATGYNYKINWNGQTTGSAFSVRSTAGMSTKMFTLHSAISGPVAGSNLGYTFSTPITHIEDPCGMVERNTSNPHGYPNYAYLALAPGAWSSNGAQALCPYGIGAHGDLYWDGYAWLGANKNASGTSVKVYYQDIYFHHPVSCLDAKNKGTLNQAGNTGDGIYTLDPDGYLIGTPSYNAYCDMTTDNGGWTLVASAWVSSYAASVNPSIASLGQFMLNNGDAKIPAFKDMRHYCKRNSGAVVHRKRSYSTTLTTTNLNIFGSNGYGASEVLLSGHNTTASSNWVMNGGYTELHFYYGDSNRFIIRPNSSVHCGANYSALGGEVNNQALGQEGFIFVR